MLEATISSHTLSVTFSRELAAGRSPSNSPDGEQMSLFGPQAAPVRRLASREKKEAALNAQAVCLSRALDELATSYARSADTHGSTMNAISGRKYGGSPRSVALNESLGNRLPARMEGYGSPEYALRWKFWDIALGPPICALQASTRRTSGNGFGGWPSPQNRQRGGGDYTDPEKVLARWDKGRQHNLSEAAILAGWATVSSQGSAGEISEDLERVGSKWRNKKTGRILQTNLATDAKMLTAGWGTPTAGDAKSRIRFGGGNLANEGLLSGIYPKHGPASTEKRGALNPEFCRWLMGFPEEWGKSKPTATPSSRKSPPSS